MLDDSRPEPLPPSRAPAKMGRPTVMTEAIKDAILERLAAGESLRTICADDDMPCRRTVFSCMAADADFLHRYRAAREAGAEALVDEALDIADDGTNDWMERANGGVSLNGEAVARSKLRTDTRMRLAAFYNPKRFSERHQVDHGIREGDPLAEILRLARRSALPLGLGLGAGQVVEADVVPAQPDDDDPEP